MKPIKHIVTAVAISLSLSAWAQVRPLEVELTDPNSFSMIILPDPQSYVKFEANQPILDLMTAWCAENLDRLNVMSVLCTGDLVEHNEIRIPDGQGGDQTSRQQWEAVSRSFARLDNRTPYIVCTGNHDYGYKRAENRETNMPDYFPSERNSLWRESLVECGLDKDGVPTLENAAYRFQSDTWGKMVVISLEFAPRDSAIEWAKEVAAKYKDSRIILLTHSYLDIKGERIETEGYALTGTNYGEAIWNKLIKVSPNIRFVLCGHSCTIGSYEENVSFRVDKNSAGIDVPQMMFNAQSADGQWSGNGGDGWLRYLEFMPDGVSVKVKTLSPLFAISPKTVDIAWRKEPYDEFIFTIDK